MIKPGGYLAKMAHPTQCPGFESWLETRGCENMAIKTHLNTFQSKRKDGTS